MGLLARASSNPVPTEENVPAETPLHETGLPLEEMGTALSERIRRLSSNSSTPYTALSLLKAYGAFQSGMCLFQKDGVYCSYTSVGMGVDKISIPQIKIWSEDKAQLPYFKLDSELNLGTSADHEHLAYWIFPLVPAKGNPPEPWEEVMILSAAENSESFNPKSISAIISDVADKFLIREKQALSESAVTINDDAAQSSYKSGAEDTDTLKEKIADYHNIHPVLNCILLEIPESANEEEKADFCKKVSNMLSMTGTVLSLSGGLPLILLPDQIDRDLIAHRLSKSLKTKSLMSFEADSPENVYRKIQSLL